MIAGVAGRDGGGAIAPEDIRAELERVLASDIFRSAPQLTAFLGYVVEEALAGRSSELKGYTIAVEAFGRPSDFDPQSDPIVRVEAGRLRKALNLYFAAEGASDPIRISIPIGAYVPRFTRLAEPYGKGESAATAPPARAERPRPQGGGWIAAACGLLVAALLALGARQVLNSVDETGAARSGGALQGPPAALTVAPDQVATAPPASPVVAASMPVIAVLTNGDAIEPAVEDATRLFMRYLVDTMARFDDLLVVKTPAMAARPQDGADYVLTLGAGRTREQVEGYVRLSAARDGRVVWTGSSERSPSVLGEAVELRDMAQQLAIRLAQPYGILHGDLRLAVLPPAVGCIYQAFNVRRRMRADEHLAARSCLDGLLARDPEFHPAWSQLAMLAADEYAYGFNVRDGAPLDRALAAAVNAVRLAPASARAHQAMMEAQFLRGATEDALKSGQEALRRNPYDPDIMADLGARYVQLDRSAEGVPLLERAVALSNGRPSWYDVFLYFAAYLTGASKLAAHQASLLRADTTPLALIARAVAGAAGGDRADAEAALHLLGQNEPLFSLDARLYLSRKGFSAAVSDRLLTAIGQLGLPPP